MVQILEICRKFSDLHREWLPGDKYDVTQTILEQEERRQQLKRRQSSDKKEEEEEKRGGGEECEKDKIMTEKEDRTMRMEKESLSRTLRNRMMTWRT